MANRRRRGSNAINRLDTIVLVESAIPAVRSPLRATVHAVFDARLVAVSSSGGVGMEESAVFIEYSVLQIIVTRPRVGN